MRAVRPQRTLQPRRHFARTCPTAGLVGEARTGAQLLLTAFGVMEEMPIVAMLAIDLLDMAVLRLTLAQSQHHSQVGQEPFH